jgi:flagellar basal-body rod protein FlgG
MKVLSTAVTGMQAQEAKLEQIANDLSNMNTTAFKRGRTEFQDLMYQTVKEAGGVPGQNQAPVGIQIGSGSRVAASYAIYDQGPTKITNGLTDLMIDGDGFFQIQLPTGQIGYTRAGNLHINKDGVLVTSAGYPLIPNIQIPSGSQGITITPEGQVRVMTAQGTETEIGRIQLANFMNPGALRKIAGTIVTENSAAGPANVGNPGEGGIGTIHQGALEGSNVNATNAVMEMISTQRTYEANSKMMTIGDQIWSQTNNIINR